MKKLAFLIIIMFIQLFAFCQQKARVLNVIDGDTYVLKIENRIFKVRLNNIDAPESKQYFGATCTKKVSDLIKGKLVEFDSTGTDLYGRVLGDIYINNKSLDEILISEGWAFVFEKYNKKEMLIEMQLNAQKKKYGMWKCDIEKICTPEIFRNLDDRQRRIFCKGCK